jgi:hypothetical protein
VPHAAPRRQVRARGVEAMVAAMARLRGHAMVQLSALLAFIPLALENAALQAHVAALALGEVLAAMAAHRRVANVQAKGLIVLGVLGQARRRPLYALGPNAPLTLCGQTLVSPKHNPGPEAPLCPASWARRAVCCPVPIDKC